MCERCVPSWYRKSKREFRAKYNGFVEELAKIKSWRVLKLKETAVTKGGLIVEHKCLGLFPCWTDAQDKCNRCKSKLPLAVKMILDGEEIRQPTESGTWFK